MSDELPPLPEPDKVDDGAPDTGFWGEAAVYAYAREAVRACEARAEQAALSTAARTAKWERSPLKEALGETIRRLENLVTKQAGELEQLRAQAKAEPVAWRYQPEEGATVWAYAEVQQQFHEPSDWRQEALYAHPPVAPIPNDEFIQEAMRLHGVGCEAAADYAIARERGEPAPVIEIDESRDALEAHLSKLATPTTDAAVSEPSDVQAFVESRPMPLLPRSTLDLIGDHGDRAEVLRYAQNFAAQAINAWQARAPVASKPQE